MSIVVIDYGVGNLRNVYKALEAAGAPARIVTEPGELAGAAGIVLPGVGAFGDAAANLRRAGFERPLLDAIAAGVPLLGICVGMQLLFDESEEMGRHAGLGVIPGRVVKFASDLTSGMEPLGGVMAVQPAKASMPGHSAQGAADRLEPAPSRRDRSAAGRRARRRVRVFRPLLLLRAGRSGLHRREHRLRDPLRLDRAPRQRLGHPVPSGEEPGGGVADFGEFRVVRRAGELRCGGAEKMRTLFALWSLWQYPF